MVDPQSNLSISGVTWFMRDVENFPSIDTILRDDSLGRKHTKIKIGVVGCSTGEQVYSYAMLCDKYVFSDYQIDGCDISEDRLIVARGGNYLLDDKLKNILEVVLFNQIML